MPRTARRPHDWLTLGLGFLAGIIWASHALRAMFMGDDVSTKALFACTALVLVGFALGAVVWVLAAPNRAKRSLSAVAASREMKAPMLMLALTAIGLGASPILGSSGACDWVLMVSTSLVGGLNLGIFFLMGADQGGPSDPLHGSVAAPQSNG